MGGAICGNGSRRKRVVRVHEDGVWDLCLYLYLYCVGCNVSGWQSELRLLFVSDSVDRKVALWVLLRVMIVSDSVDRR